jgi:hypothetical protein
MALLKSVAAGMIGVLALAGCSDLKPMFLADLAEVREDASRPVMDIYYDAQGRPFAKGPISIVADDDGVLRMFQLYPCGTNTACYASANGRRLGVKRELHLTVITGIEPGHVYYLSPGGEGYIVAHGERATRLAWE